MKVITLRLTDDEYKKISGSAADEHRPISNFITVKILKDIEESFYVDPVEIAQINADKRLLEKIKNGHRGAGKMKGKFVG